MNPSAIWQEHRKFLTQVAGVAAGFLIILLVLRGYLEGYVAESESAIKAADREQKRVKDMGPDYSFEVSERDTLKERLEDLLSRTSLLSERRETPESQFGDVKFSKARDDVYTSFIERAIKVNLRHPPIGDIEFGQSLELSDEEWQDQYVLLDAFEQILNACVDNRVEAILEVSPEAVEVTPIADSDQALYRYPIEIKIRLPYGRLLQLYSSFQSEQNFLALEVVSLDGSAESNQSVTAVLRLSGVGIGEPRESTRKRPRRVRRR